VTDPGGWRASDEAYCSAVAAALEAAGVGTAGYTQTGGGVHCVLIPTRGGGEWSFGLADTQWGGCLLDREGAMDDDSYLELGGCFTSAHENPYGDNPAPPEYVARRILEALDDWAAGRSALDPAGLPMYDRRRG
jgi:hypothetical protein